MANRGERYTPIVARDQFEYDLIRAFVERMATSWPASQEQNVKVSVDTNDGWRQDWDGTFTVTLSLTTEKETDGFDIRASLDDLYDLQQIQARAWVSNDGGRAVSVWEIKGQPGVADQFNTQEYAPDIDWTIVPMVPPLSEMTA